MVDPICEYTATDLLQLIAKKEVSSFEILQLCIKQYERLNPSLNAIVETNFEDAFKCSYDIDRVSNKKILLENLNYWSVKNQEAYFSYIEASIKREKDKS